MSKPARYILSRSLSEDGFTLIESIAAVVLVSLTIGGLFITWYMTETRDRKLEDYWKAKGAVELAYQITQKILRTEARGSALALINSDQGISFTGNDGLAWFFTKEGTNYILSHDGKEEVLLNSTCDHASFQLTGSMVTIQLGVIPPPNGNLADDLNITGKVWVRNP